MFEEAAFFNPPPACLGEGDRPAHGVVEGQAPPPLLPVSTDGRRLDMTRAPSGRSGSETEELTRPPSSVSVGRGGKGDDRESEEERHWRQG